MIQWLKMQYPTYTMNTIEDMVVVTTQLVRQGGLPQGAVHSPLLARGFVGRELQALLGGEEGIVGLSWIDDLTIGTRLKMDAQAAVHALTERFKTHPAGPLELHVSTVHTAASRRGRSARIFPRTGQWLWGHNSCEAWTKTLRKFQDQPHRPAACSGTG
jgi:hypothetical protein